MINQTEFLCAMLTGLRMTFKFVVVLVLLLSAYIIDGKLSKEPKGNS